MVIALPLSNLVVAVAIDYTIPGEAIFPQPERICLDGR